MPIQTPEWVKDAIFYQIFPDRFAQSEKVAKPGNLEPWDAPPTTYGFKGGDFIGMTEHLEYLVDLGITAIYFNPVFVSAANHRYHTHDYYHIDPILGGDATFRTFLDAAHAAGIRVMLDGVFNHASRGFLQFNHILENGPASPYLDWFIVHKFPLHAYEGHKHNYEAWFNLRELPKLNTDNPRVRHFLLDVAEYWLNFGIDGWRLDVPLEIKTPGFWEEFRRHVKRINPEAYILAEIWEESQPWLQGEHFDATMNYLFNRACLGFFGGEALDTSERPGGFKLKRFNAKSFAREIERQLGLYDWNVTLVQYNLLSSHDEPRFRTLVGGDTRRFRLATLFQMVFPGPPGIYYGDEIGMEGGNDPDCRRAFPWDDRLWDKPLLEDVRKFIALRKAHSALRRGDFSTLHAKGDVYAIARHDEGETLVIAFNVGSEPQEVTLDVRKVAPATAVPVDVWSGEPATTSEGRLTLTIPPLDARVVVYA